MIGAAAWQLSGIPWTFDFSSKLTALPTVLRRMNATYTRNSVKNVVQDGVLVQLAANQFGTSYDDVTGLYGYVPEPVATNNALYSSAMSNAAWVKSGLSVTAASVTAPDGTTSTDSFLAESATSAVHRMYMPSGNTYGTSAYTASVFLKAGTRTVATIGVGNSRYTRGTVNLTTGVCALLAGGGDNATFAMSSRAMGNGWWRVNIAGNHAVADINHLWVGIYNGAESYAGDGTSGLYCWGAQSESGLRMSSYIPTASATATRAADVLSVPLLVNRILNSDSLSSGSLVGVTRSLAAAADPVTGLLTASRLTEGTSTGMHYVLHTVAIGCAASSIQLCLKANGRTKIKIRGENPQFNNLNTVYDLTGSGAVLSGTGTITALSNGWYFVTATNTGGTGASGYIVVLPLDAGLNETYTGDGVSGFYVARMQAEAGAVATAYRPTTSTLESVANANIPGFSSTGYTLYADHRYATLPQSSRALLSTGDLSANNSSFLIATSTLRGANVNVNGSNTSSVNLSSASTSRSKLAASFALANNRVALDGVGASPNLSGATPTELTTLEIGGLANGNQADAFLFRVGLIPQALTQDQINAMTVL